MEESRSFNKVSPIKHLSEDTKWYYSHCIDIDMEVHGRLLSWAFDADGACVKRVRGNFPGSEVLQPGDRLIRINGVNVNGMDKSEICRIWDQEQQESSLMTLGMRCPGPRL